MSTFEKWQLALNACFVLMFAFQWGVNRGIAKSLAFVKVMLSAASGAFAYTQLQRYALCPECGSKKHDGECDDSFVIKDDEL